MSAVQRQETPFKTPFLKRKLSKVSPLFSDDNAGNSEDEETMVFNIRRPFLRSPTPSDDEGASIQDKNWMSRRRKEMRELKAAQPRRLPLPRELSDEEKRADRIRRYGFSHVDAWLEAMIDDSQPPTEKDNDYRWIVGAEPVRLLDVDKVTIVVTVGSYEHLSEPDDPFVNDFTFTLQLQAHVPPQCGFMCYYNTSPPFVIDAWKGLKDDDRRPFWVDTLHLNPSPIFWTTRIAAVELARASSLYQWNVPQKVALLDWCSALTRGSFADRKVLALYYPPGVADPPPFVVNPPARASNSYEDYLARRHREVGTELTPTRRGRAPLVDMVNTI